MDYLHVLLEKMTTGVLNKSLLSSPNLKSNKPKT